MLLLMAMGCSAADEYTMLPEDCYDDEQYDEADQMCYLTCELDDTCEAAGLGDWLRDFTEQLGAFSFVGDDEPNVVILYTVDGNRIRDPVENEPLTDEEAAILDDTANHKVMWQQFANIIPQAQRMAIAKYGVFTDGEENTMAYVEPNPDDPTTWILVLDAADAVNQEEQTYTLIHEFGHVLTLNDNQVPFDENAYFAEDDTAVEEAESACPTFFAGEGCSRNQSYINAFYDRFWADIYGEWEAAEFDETAVSDDLYPQYEDRFLTAYAATNPGEDIAESWTHFVLYPKPEADTVAAQKVRFFYDYPELVTLRAQIVGRLYSQSRARER